MQETNPEIHREIAPSPEQAGEAFYEQAQKRTWSTEKEKHELKDGVEGVTGVAAEKKAETEEVHHEAGVPLKPRYNSEQEALAAINNLIKSGSDVHPNDLQSEMTNAWEQMNDK